MLAQTHGIGLPAKLRQPDAPDKQHYHPDERRNGNRLSGHQLANQVLRKSGAKNEKNATAPMGVHLHKQEHPKHCCGDYD